MTSDSTNASTIHILDTLFEVKNRVVPRVGLLYTQVGLTSSLMEPATFHSAPMSWSLDGNSLVSPCGIYVVSIFSKHAAGLGWCVDLLETTDYIPCVYSTLLIPPSTHQLPGTSSFLCMEL